jgi:hypothetical protein
LAVDQICFLYLETVELLGALSNFEDAEELFIRVLHAEIEEGDAVFELNEKTWSLPKAIMFVLINRR